MSREFQMPKILIIIAAPFCIAAAFFTVLFREFKVAFRYAWLEVQMEADSIKSAWRYHHHS